MSDQKGHEEEARSLPVTDEQYLQLRALEAEYDKIESSNRYRYAQGQRKILGDEAFERFKGWVQVLAPQVAFVDFEIRMASPIAHELTRLAPEMEALLRGLDGGPTRMCAQCRAARTGAPYHHPRCELARLLAALDAVRRPPRGGGPIACPWCGEKGHATIERDGQRLFFCRETSQFSDEGRPGVPRCGEGTGCTTDDCPNNNCVLLKGHSGRHVCGTGTEWDPWP